MNHLISKCENSSRLQFKFVGKTYDVAVKRFHAEENVSETYEVTLWLVSENKIDFKDVIQQEGLFTIKGKSKDRHFHGIINHFMFTGKGGRFFFYQATLVPSLWLLSLRKGFKIFQYKTIEEIITEVLEFNGITSDGYAFRLTNDYRKRRYCTQYGESDLHFISRLLDEEGIFYFFEHSKTCHLLVMADDTVAYKQIEGESEIRVCVDAGMAADTEVIDRFGHVQSIRPGKVTHTNYNFKRPSLDLKAEVEGDTHRSYELYEFPAPHGLPDGGHRNAQIRLEEIKTLEETAQGTSNCPRLTPGFTMVVNNDDYDEPSRRFLFVSVEHEGSQSHVTGEYSGIGGDSSYSNQFLAIPASVTLRPEKTLEKPFVPGLQTAVVTGPEGHEVHTDEYGRVKVQFHWDREGKRNDRSSCWLRTSQPWSGNGWGFVSLPRVGDEVLVAFINGDPDWPIVVGCVNNAASPALYRLPANKTQSGIRTRSTPGGGPGNFNELRFEDRKGAEEVFLQAEKDLNVLVKNHKTEKVQASKMEAVGADKTINVGKSFDITVGETFSITCGNSKISMDAAGNVTITGAKFHFDAFGPVRITGDPVDIN